MKRMNDIKEDILISYFPEFLDEKMLKFVELKFQLEDNLEKLTHWGKKKKKKLNRITHKSVKEQFESIERDKSTINYWSHNKSTRRVYAKEIRNSVKSSLTSKGPKVDKVEHFSRHHPSPKTSQIDERQQIYRRSEMGALRQVWKRSEEEEAQQRFFEIRPWSAH
jgi:hypothetical protein